MNAPLPVIKRDALNRVSRPVEVPWTCKKSGDCCRTPSHLTVTAQERTIMEGLESAATRRLEFILHPEEQQRHDAIVARGEIDTASPRFYMLVTHPCPFLTDQSLCAIHTLRPFNCRRFSCGRIDTTTEAYEQGGPMGCYNVSDRIATSLRFQEWYAAQERHAQRDWARTHGWVK